MADRVSAQADTDRLLDAFWPYRRLTETYRALPAEGVPHEQLIGLLDELARREDELAEQGKMSGSVYHGGKEHFAFIAQAFQRFAHANVLQRDVYPSSTKFEAEIVAMTSDLLHGTDAGAVGVITGGGTESLINAVLVYRERGRRRGITEPEVIMPVTGHVAVDKAGHYLGVKVIHGPVTADYVADVDFVREHIGPNTVALWGSAGNYPHGLIDPIEELSELAVEHDLGLHVDGCLGGFILPLGERLGLDIPRFDFRLPGVTSISADTHKYGFGPKGTSVLLYRTRELRHLQYFKFGEWPGGLYASPGLAGSRSGGLIAATWAAMVALGEQGYLEVARRVFDTAAGIRRVVESIPELQVIGEPTFLVAFKSDEVDIYHVNDALKERGWRMNGLQLPPALHFCVTLPNTQPGVVEQFAEDLRAAVEYAKDPPPEPPRSGALYAGGAGHGQIEATLEGALDAMYELAPPD